MLRRFICAFYPKSKKGLAKSTEDPKIFTILSKDEKVSLAESTQDPDILAILGKDQMEMVRYKVAHNSRTPSKVLGAMENDSYHPVRSGVCFNSSTPLEVRVRLISQLDFNAREAMAIYAGKFPREMIEILAEDRDQGIRGIARRFLKETS